MQVARQFRYLLRSVVPCLASLREMKLSGQNRVEACCVFTYRKLPISRKGQVNFIVSTTQDIRQAMPRIGRSKPLLPTV